MSDKSLLEGENLQAGNGSGENTGSNKSGKKATAAAKKALKREMPKVVPEPASVAKPDAAKSSKAAAKKVAAKKVSEKQTEAVVPKTAKPKKAVAAKKQSTTSALPPTVIPEAEKSQAQLPAEESQAPVIEPAKVEAKQPEVAKPQTGVAEPRLHQETKIAKKRSILRKITFQIRFHTQPGESLFVAGNHPLLGNNNFDDAFALSYLDQEFWTGTLIIPADQLLSNNVTYNYVLKNADGTYNAEWGTDKIIAIDKIDSEEVLLIDTWNPSSLVENTYYTEPFQEVLLKENFTEVHNVAPEKVTHIFRAKAPLLAKGQALCIVGSIPELNKWSVEKPLLLTRERQEIWHSVAVDLSNADFPFNYKYGVFDTNTNTFIQYEAGSNRVVNDSSSHKLTVISDGFAAIPNSGFHGAGVAIPVFSLRSASSFGVGEFTDLKLLVDWAKKVGLKLIQLLPVNDTTATHTYTDSYPYAAISAFALHALYLHLPAIVNKENEALLTSLKTTQEALNNKAEVDYVAVMDAKWHVIKQVFPSLKHATFSNADFTAFFNENAHWLVPYAAFSYLREQNNTADFNSWSSHQRYNADEINKLAGSPTAAIDEISVYYFVQYYLHLQLKEATTYAHENGIIVKGDIPIGIYRNSCDAWQEPELFYMDMQAGAPPDDFAVKGQNWGFPTYNWQKMREDGFSWWKKRFKQMSYYFDAFRIDHILGFFRIWSIPMNAVEGIMGHFVPALPVQLNEITDTGITFNYERFCKPFINESILQELFGENYRHIVSTFLDKSGDETYNLKEAFNTQRKVEAYFSQQDDNAQNLQLKEGLYNLISNVILLKVEGSNQQQFHFRIAMADTTSYQHLNGLEKHYLYELYVNYFFRRQDNFWLKEAMMKLPELKRSTNMLICGEDLGMVPECVPGVMKELAILSLEIQRMPKDPTREFFHPNDAPYLSVVTPSTHDMSTVRGWWEEDRAATQRFFNSQLGQWGTAPYFCEPWINRIIILQHLYSPAMWSIFQLQDLLGMNARLRRENPNEERINVPANPKNYWRYRMHISLEDLLNEDEFTTDLKTQVTKSGR